MITAYYKNSKGETLDLLNYPYRTADADWFDSEWDETIGGEYQKTVQVDVFGNNAEDFAQNMERLYSVTAVDPEEGAYGRLYVNDTFLRCRIQTSRKTSWQGYVYAEVELTFTAPEISWITEVTKQFFPQDDSADTGLDFPYDHPFEFAEDDTGSKAWDIEHVGSSEFQMIMYGPCTNPYVMLNGHSYAVYTDLEQDEYLIIDSQNCTVLKHQSDGMIQNLFHERGLDDSVFEPVPSGLIRISWPGTFGFDLTLFLKRREARW